MNYQAEQAAAVARHDARKRAGRIEVRARRLLNLAGWDADAVTLLVTASAQMSEVIQDDERDDVVRRALEMQTDESIRGRRVRPEELQMPKAHFDRATRDKIRERIREIRKRDPDVKAEPVRAQLCREFGVEISSDNWYMTYWSPISREINTAGIQKPAARTVDARVAAKASPPAAAPTAEETAKSANAATSAQREDVIHDTSEDVAASARSANRAAPPARITPAPTASTIAEPTVIGPPVLQLLPLSNGRVRIVADIDFELGAALATLAAAVTARRP